MHKLAKSDYKKVLPLLDDLENNRALVYSIIEGTNEGNVFVDDFQDPKSAFIEWEFSFLVGKSTNRNFIKDVQNYIFNDMIPHHKDKELVLFFANDKWSKAKNMFIDQNCIIIERKMFSFNRHLYLNKFGKGKLEDTIIKFKHFEDNKFSFYLEHDNTSISECKTVAVGDAEAEIDIATLEEYRQKGYATQVARAFIEYCIDHDLAPNWSCWPFRKESIHLAQKLGFEEEENIEVIYWSESI